MNVQQCDRCSVADHRVIICGLFQQKNKHMLRMLRLLKLLMTEDADVDDFAADAELAEDAEDCKFTEDDTEILRYTRTMRLLHRGSADAEEVSKVVNFLGYDEDAENADSEIAEEVEDVQIAEDSKVAEKAEIAEDDDVSLYAEVPEVADDAEDA
jgi:hypothetical protein